MKKLLFSMAIALTPLLAHGADKTLTVYQDPNCGCCGAWAQYMQEEGYTVNTIKTNNIVAVKQKLGIPPHLSSCHTAIIESTGQLVEGHVPANVVEKLIAQPSVKGVAAPGMPHNAPGMGELDGNLITVDLNGKPFSRD